MPLNDEAHLNEGYSYDQSSFRSWFVEGVNGDDFCINYINRKEKHFCVGTKAKKNNKSASKQTNWLSPGIYVNWISLATGLIFLCRSWYLKHTTFPFRVAASNSCSPAWHSPYMLLCEGKRLKLSSTNGHTPFISGNILQIITTKNKYRFSGTLLFCHASDKKQHPYMGGFVSKFDQSSAFFAPLNKSYFDMRLSSSAVADNEVFFSLQLSFLHLRVKVIFNTSLFLAHCPSV